MLGQALRGLGANTLRTALTALAIALSVGLVAGTFVMGDTINKTFSDVFSDATAGTDVRVQSADFSNDDDNPVRIPASLAAQVSDIEGVAAAEPVIQRWGVVILDADGEPIGGNGPPQFGWVWNTNPSINPFDLREGRAPVKADEVVVDATSAEAGGYEVGDKVSIAAFAQPAKQYTLTGIAGFGSEDNLALATIASFAPEHAATILETGNTATFVDVVAEDGVSQQVLAERVNAALPSSAVAITGEQAGADLFSSVEGEIGLFRNILLGFGSVALLVAAFTIFNTFAITVAQRTRQLALFRAVGASPGQVRRLMLVEALILGLGASIVGLGLGVLLALGLFELFGALGASLPATDPVLSLRTVWVALLVGTVATVAAAMLPAWRASRIPPIAALQGTQAEAVTLSRFARVGGVAIPALGLGLVALGIFGGLGLLAVLAGSLLVLVGAAIALQMLARPVVSVLGAPLRRFGLSGRLAGENAKRNPRRAAITAGALMIGLALVTVASIFTASAKTSITETIDANYPANFAVFSEEFPLEPAIGNRLARDPNFSAVARFQSSDWARADGTESTSVVDVLGVDPTQLLAVYNPDVTEGDISGLGLGEVALQESYAKDAGVTVGDVLVGRIGDPRGTGSQGLEVVAIYKDSSSDDLMVSRAAYPAAFGKEDDYILLRTAEGVDHEAAKVVVGGIGKEYPTITAQDREEFKAAVVAEADQLLTLIIALLALAIIIAVLGIVNTLALSVVERTREIGLLRAVGMSRRQVAGMIRGESVLLAVLGGVVGTAVGVGLAALLVPQVPDTTVLEIPFLQLGLFLVACVVVGVVAALLPARRAARLDVLRAISAD